MLIRWLMWTSGELFVRNANAFLLLIRKSHGRIMNVASMLGRSPAKFSGAYIITKYDVEEFSDILRLEMERFNVGVSIIEPEFNGSHWSCWCKTPQTVLESIESVRKDYGEDSVDEIETSTEWITNKFGVNKTINLIKNRFSNFVRVRFVNSVDWLLSEQRHESSSERHGGDSYSTLPEITLLCRLAFR